MTPLSGSDGIRWHPVSVIEKYSPDQVRFARRYFGGLPGGDALRGLFIGRGPECGIVRDEGNGVTVFGTANLALLLTGAGGYPLAPGSTVFGVGSDDTRFSREHVHLANAAGEEPGRSWYRPADHGYPALPRPGVIEVQATFLEHEACFAWQEWCVAAGPGEPVPHHSLSGAYDGEQAVMVNRRSHPAGYGTKEPGVAWCFKVAISVGS